jgi:hypothetical protein
VLNERAALVVSLGQPSIPPSEHTSLAPSSEGQRSAGRCAATFVQVVATSSQRSVNLQRSGARHDHPMPIRDGPVSRATRAAVDDQRRVLAELARAQRTAGLSDEDVGRASRMSRWMVARIVDGRRRASLVELAAIGAAVGRDIRMHAYTAGDPIRDAGQQRLLDRFRRRLDPSLVVRTEVPLPIAGDRRAWDAMIGGVDWRRPAEAESVLDDLQALERRLALKVRDGEVDGVILVIADTRRNRQALAAAPGCFAGFDRNARRVLSALAAGRDPGGSSLLVV